MNFLAFECVPKSLLPPDLFSDLGTHSLIIHQNIRSNYSKNVEPSSSLLKTVTTDVPDDTRTSNHQFENITDIFVEPII